jgi:WhiB family transcriptional regulator, redox-sensing transcriptional regulator
MTGAGTVTNWRSAGACLSADPDLFFPISTSGPAQGQIARAKMICAGCGVRQECLQFAMSHDQLYGIWGGTTPEDRQRDRRRKRRAAAAAAKRAVAVLSPRVIAPCYRPVLSHWRPATGARASAPCRPAARRCRRAW